MYPCQHGILDNDCCMMKIIFGKLRMNVSSTKLRRTETQIKTHERWGEVRGGRHKINKLYKVGRPKKENTSVERSIEYQCESKMDVRCHPSS